MPTTTAGVLMSITPKSRVQLQDYPLEEIDEMRDIILSTKGNKIGRASCRERVSSPV